MKTAKRLFDTYIASRDALLAFAAEEFKKLADDAELLTALAWFWECSPTEAKNALLNPHKTHIEQRTNGVGEEVGLDFIVTASHPRRRTHSRWRHAEIPLELLICEAGAFATWRQAKIDLFKKRSEECSARIVRNTRNAVAAYRRLPVSVREANPIPGVKR